MHLQMLRWGAWVKGVARLQVTSHVLGAALGFALTVAGPLAGRSVVVVLRENLWPSLLVLALSAFFAIAAGRREAKGIIARGIRRPREPND